ncbi:Carbonic anhydrase [Elsinoe australis]|uniref:Carbonic anhydrase n=1 Tax=Elsinoe australis TaxID=40998 RepID=A0A2P8AJ39_9PEZI|nr:Carbonic anhydrase [Elsinoe australis]
MAASNKPADAFTRALAGHAEWRTIQQKNDPHIFENLSKGQSPKILWIGCSDSRIPAEQILNLKPGDVFVHRNIANVLAPSDLSSLSVIEFAVAHLKVEHAVVCGHTSCGGVQAALGNKSLGVLDMWLQPIKQLRWQHEKELEAAGEAGRARRLSELNVLNSLEVLKMNPTVIEAVRKRGLKLHGLIYDLKQGQLEVLDGEEEEEMMGRKFDVFAVEQS